MRQDGWWSRLLAGWLRGLALVAVADGSMPLDAVLDEDTLGE